MKEERQVGKSCDRQLPHHPQKKEEGLPGGTNFFRKLKETEENEDELKNRLRANFKGLI